MRTSNGLLISDFIGYLKYECGATDNAIADHEKSLAHLAAWLAPMWLPDATRIMLQLYIGNCLSQGISARAISRRLSHFRRFYAFLVNENEIAIDPTKDLPMPKHYTTAKPPHSVPVATWVRMDWDTYTL